MKRLNYLLLLVALVAAATQLSAQATLSVQGLLQKTSGASLDDDTYALTFKLYTVETGGTAIWTETQDIEVAGGVYSAVLGAVTPLTVPFNTTYFLGVTANGTELLPRAKLTSSPYALSLLGNSNVFPSSGPVGAGTATPTAGKELHVKNAAGPGDVLVEGNTGASASLAFKVGTDTAALKLTTSGDVDVIDADLNLTAGANLKYQGVNDWRLVDVDDFTTNADGWNCYVNWNSATTTTNFERMSPGTAVSAPFSEGFLLRPTHTAGQSGTTFKKQFTGITTPHTMVKVVFTYHFFDSWGSAGGNPEFGYAAFSTVNNPTSGANNQFQLGWYHFYKSNDSEAPLFSGTGYTNFQAGSTTPDFNLRAEMVAQDSGSDFWIFIGSNLNEAANDEGFGISNIEIWVK